MARRLGPALLGVGVVAYWFTQAPVPTAVIFGLTAGFFVVERLTGTARRDGLLDDRAHLSVTTLLVRLTGIELVMSAFRDLRGGLSLIHI